MTNVLLTVGACGRVGVAEFCRGVTYGYSDCLQEGGLRLTILLFTAYSLQVQRASVALNLLGIGLCSVSALVSKCVALCLDSADHGK